MGKLKYAISKVGVAAQLYPLLLFIQHSPIQSPIINEKHWPTLNGLSPLSTYQKQSHLFLHSGQNRAR